jgi:hypothetical protein
VTISGRHFGAGSTVTFGGVPAEVLEATDTMIRAVTPPGRIGMVAVEVTNAGGRSDRLDNAFEYQGVPPRIDGVLPDFGPLEGGNEVRIFGEGFSTDEARLSVSFGLLYADVLAASPDELLVVAPEQPQPGLVSVWVTNPAGSFDKRDDAYTYAEDPTPVVDSIEPSSGPPEGGNDVTIRGRFFWPEADRISVNFEMLRADVTAATSTELHVVAPHGSGAVTLRIVNPDGRYVEIPNAYTYDLPPVTFIRGDADRNDTVNLGDAVTILEYLFASGVLRCLDAADTNDDQQIDIGDPIELLGYLFGDEDPPPDPFPDPGLDPTPDELGCSS